MSIERHHIKKKIIINLNNHFYRTTEGEDTMCVDVKYYFICFFCCYYLKEYVLSCSMLRSLKQCNNHMFTCVISCRSRRDLLLIATGPVDFSGVTHSILNFAIDTNFGNNELTILIFISLHHPTARQFCRSTYTITDITIK
jgi:hypothetical protein